MKYQILILIVIFSFAIANEYSYENNGEDWPGTCSTGQRQSPINIVDGVNTEEDNFSEVEFDYKLSDELKEQIKNSAQNNSPMTFTKLQYNGLQLELNENFGKMIFKHPTGEEEEYESEKIVLHYPSEHYVTMDGQTPRYALELQIEHSLSKTASQALTDSVIKVKKAIVSILFLEAQNAPAGDLFLSRLGIDKRRKNADGTYRVVQKGNEVDFNPDEVKRGSEPPGFDIDALSALRNLLNLDHQIFRYFGSETHPPCEENVHWFVFAMPRAMSTEQTQYFKEQLANQRNDESSKALINVNPLAGKWYGNNRSVHAYDREVNGSIQSMLSGISRIEGMPIPKL